MRVRYENEGDALYIPIDRRAVLVRTVAIDERRYVDLDADGKAVGIEIWAASRSFKLGDLVERFGLQEKLSDYATLEKHHFQPMVYSPPVDRQRAL